MDRGRRNFSVQAVKEEKSEDWKQDIWQMITYCAEIGAAPKVSLPESTPLAARREAPLTKV